VKDWQGQLDCALHAAEEAGKLIESYFEQKFNVIRKEKKELVTELDVRSQNIITSILLSGFPEYPIIAEESKSNQKIEGLTWVVDPLDGTHNYIAGLDNFGISIALISNLGVHVGVMFFPLKSKMLYAKEGFGAYCNGVRTYVSKNKNIANSMILYDNQFYLSHNSLRIFQNILQGSFTVRILGSAAWDIALLVMGKVDARVWNNTKLVDIAAGIVLVKEAKGQITDFDYKEIKFKPMDVVASNGLIHKSIVELINQ
jgi:myo-inositol-1(or 4)-monophosphatase